MKYKYHKLLTIYIIVVQCIFIYILEIIKCRDNIHFYNTRLPGTKYA